MFVYWFEIFFNSKHFKIFIKIRKLIFWPCQQVSLKTDCYQRDEDDRIIWWKRTIVQISFKIRLLLEAFEYNYARTTYLKKIHLTTTWMILEIWLRVIETSAKQNISSICFKQLYTNKILKKDIRYRIILKKHV